MKIECQDCHGDHPTACCPELAMENDNMTAEEKEEKLLIAAEQNTRKRLHDAVDKFLEKAFASNQSFDDGLHSTLKIHAGTNGGFATAMIKETHREDVA